MVDHAFGPNWTAEGISVPVLIVGGGPVGMMSALLLARMGVPSLCIERKSGTATHPKARGFSIRSMELFRELGIADRVRAAQPARERIANFAAGKSLGDPDLKTFPFMGRDTGDWDVSPESGSVGSQDIVEHEMFASLRRTTLAHHRFEHKLVAIAQDKKGIRATVEDDRGETIEISAQYCIAADGARSPVRRMLDVPYNEEIFIADNLNVLFEAELAEKLDPLNLTFLVVHHPDGRMGGVLSGIPTRRNLNEWTWNFQVRTREGEKHEDFTDERLVEQIRTIADDPGLEVKIVARDPWRAAAGLIENFRKGRVFFAGDSARLIPPAGGLGVNTGFLDAHALAWRLALAVRGVAGEGLLDSYDPERQQHSRMVIDQAVSNIRTPGGPQKLWTERRAGALNPVLGYWYESDAVLPDGTDTAFTPDEDYVPSGRPGGRAPHMWLDQAERLSTLDLFGGSLVVLHGANGAAWTRGAQRLHLASGLPIKAFSTANISENPDALEALYGIEPEGAVLVRPDGMVMARQKSGGGEDEVLRSAFATITGSKSE